MEAAAGSSDGTKRRAHVPFLLYEALLFYYSWNLFRQAHARASFECQSFPRKHHEDFSFLVLGPRLREAHPGFLSSMSIGNHFISTSTAPFLCAGAGMSSTALRDRSIESVSTLQELECPCAMSLGKRLRATLRVMSFGSRLPFSCIKETCSSCHLGPRLRMAGA